MTQPRLFTPAFAALFVSALIAVGGSVLLLVRRDAIARPQLETAPSRLPG